ncbi:MAG: lipoyl synthase [Planctomycetota bacterium]|nr:lipoyl synthase [Planctomycetota bacterium]
MPPQVPETPAPRGVERKPSWLKVPLPGGPGYTKLKALTRELGLNTVCQEARCPNLGECWKGGHADAEGATPGHGATMTIMVLGDECTRRCRFCAVKTVDRAAAPDPEEPENVATAVAELGLSYLVITSVDRDDLDDGGAGHYAACITATRRKSPGTVLETLIPDYVGTDLEVLMAAAPDVLSHNVEVVPRLQRKMRDPSCSFERSVDTLVSAKRLLPSVLTKSSLMLGIGEEPHEIREAMQRLRAADVDFLTLGQYLRPSPKHAPVKRYVPPAEFDELREEGEAMGFAYVASGPLVRSSYRAAEFFAERLVRARQTSRQA